MENNYGSDLSKYSTCAIIGRNIGGSLSVLDVGCNDGYLKKACSQSVKFWGVDCMPESVKNSMENNGYVKSVVADLNGSLDKIELDGKFDVVVFADVLEHLVYPEKVLRFFCDIYLKKKGKVIISLPNIANFSIRAKLLFGNFDYTESGILDKTHLHLYTLKSGKNMIVESGLCILKEKFSSNRFGGLIEKVPFVGSFLGYNLIYVCEKK